MFLVESSKAAPGARSTLLDPVTDDSLATQLQEKENLEGRERRFCLQVMVMSAMVTVW